ncbi:MAG: hypothetical protein A2X08_04545 [Bacteroidetes bacterium GWA2_32_17]|nr:MAG: hypothetical protein A2X08_04545 [Bacteroidetes bacterium GWA2_32_17]
MALQYIFGDKYFKKRLDEFKIEDIPYLEAKTKTINLYIKALESGRIEKTKEKSIQADFLNNFFGDVLGYEYKDSKKWNLEKEHKSLTDGTQADGALGFFSITDNGIREEVKAVIELKDALTDLDKPQQRQNDKRTPVEQAFSYSSKAGGKCKWVIVSNFREIRLYHSSDQGSYEMFYLPELLEQDNLKRFIYILQKENLISEKAESTIDKIYRERQEIEHTITKKFYNEYKTLRLDLFTHLKTNNKGQDEFLLFNKTQKLLDRFTFVCFCEDAGLLPPYTLKKTKEILKNAFDFEENKLWRQLKGLFQSIDKGNPPHDINKFNGGLFAKDEDLDNLVIFDDILLKLIDFSEYDFASDINVNILGHIFEQSLSDIEEIKAQIGNGKDLSHEEKSEVKKNGKRKKEGIFYTPEYITRYIVRESVGGWLEERKNELGFNNLPEITITDFQSIKTEKKKNKSTGKLTHILTFNKNIEKHIKFWESYKEKIRNIKVLDPACGSGAFLNQVFDFLYKVGQVINDKLSELRLGQREIFELDKHILTNNIYGVDLNPESVEITKLSLWLKTANKGKELTALDENIRCGNSLIADKEIAGEKAFVWSENFNNIIQNGGFDIIVGNPPYGTPFNEKEKEYLTKFDSLVPDYEIYIYFISKGTQLLNQKGILSYIFPNTFLSILYGINYRKNILDKFQILSITDLSNDQTFEDTSVRTCIFSLKNEKSENVITDLNIIQSDVKNVTPVFQISKTQLLQNIDNWLKFFHYSPEKEQVIEKIKKHQSLKEICDVSQGYIPYRRADLIKQYGEEEGNKIVDQRLWHSEKQITNEYRPEIQGKDISRYFNLHPSLFIKYGKHVAGYVEPKFFTSPRILIREIVNSYLYCAYTEEEFYNTPSIINVIQKQSNYSLKYILAILNSKLIVWYHYLTSPKAKKGLFPKILVNDVRNLPIPEVSKKTQQEFISLVDIMIKESKNLFLIKEQFLKVLKSKFNSLNITAKIDLWYELTFSDFSKELSKQKIKMTLVDQSEWISFFEEQKTSAESIKKIISDTDSLIDKRVFELYNLSEIEQNIVIQK